MDSIAQEYIWYDVGTLGNRVAAMDERKDNTRNEAAGQPDRPPRKPWHTPQFTITSLSATDHVCNAGSDAGPPSTMLS